MTQITYIKSALSHSSAFTAPEVALTEFGLWSSIKKAFKKYAKPLAAIVGIAASIAVPFIAPAVAGVIFGGTALASGAIGAAIAGAGMGAAAGALTAYGTGQNVLMGAGLGLLGGAVGGGVAGYAGSGGAFMGQAASAAEGAAGAAGAGVDLANAAALGGGQYAVPASASIGGAAPSTVAGQVGVPLGQAAATGATSAASGIGSKLLNAAIQAAPGAIGSIVSGLSGGEVAQAQAELQAEMSRLQQSDLAAYQKARELYDTLVAEYGRMDPTAYAQQAEADVQRRVAQQSSEALRGLEAAGGASGKQYAEAEQRRLQVEGAGQGSTAYGNEYWRAYGTKLSGLAGLLTPPRYGSSTAQYLANERSRAETGQAGLASDIAGVLTPFAEEFRPRDTTLTSADEEDRRLADKSQYAFT